MGYCGSGAGMAGYLGMRIGQQVLGRKDGATGFDPIRFQTRRSTAAIPGSSRPRWRITVGKTKEAEAHLSSRGRPTSAQPSRTEDTAIITVEIAAMVGSI